MNTAFQTQSLPPPQISSSPADHYIPALDGLRAIAVLIVMFGHTSIPHFKGNVGVDIFFVLSGYLITLILLRDAGQKGSLPAFYTRRWLRLFPALALLCLGLFATSFVFDNRHQVEIDIVAALLYVSNWCRAFGSDAASYLGNTWSLAVEEQFYLIWPLIFLVAIRYGGRKAVLTAAIALFACTFFWRSYLGLHGEDPDRLSNGFDTHCDGLLLGCILANVTNDALKQKIATAWQLALGILTLLIATNGWSWETALPINLAAGVLVIAASSPTTSFGRTLAWQPLVYIGKISYGLYLWHYPISILLLFQHVPNPAKDITVFVAAFALASASYHFIEAPILARRYRLPKRITKIGGVTAAMISALGIAFGIEVFLGDKIRQVLDPQPVIVEAYGPHTLKRGEVFNLQPDGKSRMWIVLSRPIPKDARIIANGETLDSATGGKTVSAVLPDSLRNSPGAKIISIVTLGGKEIIAPITIEITGNP